MRLGKALLPYLLLYCEGPRACNLTTKHRIIEVLDKGKAAAVTTQVTTKDKKTGTVIFENQSTVFIRGSGGFGGQRVGKGTLAGTHKYFRRNLRIFCCLIGGLLWVKTKRPRTRYSR